MSTELDYALADGTVKRALIVGLEADIPSYASVPPSSYYVASDTGALFVASATLGDWTSAISTADPADATTSTTGVVRLRTAPSGAPTVLTTDDLGATNGVATLDSGGLVPPAQLKKATAGVLGAGRQGTNFAIGGDGTADVTTSGTGSFGVSANGGAPVTEPIVDFEDTASVVFTLTDDGANNRVKVAGLASAALAYLTTHLTSNPSFAQGAWRDIMHLDLTAGTWVVFADGNSTTNTNPDSAEYRLSDGGTTYAATAVPAPDNRSKAVSLVSVPIVVASTRTVTWQIKPQGSTWSMQSSNSIYGGTVAARLTALRIAR